ncbi:NTP transferase domain-containing protein, partial [Candidatus Curtissbacteria bacterium]|nr:NTP transferase domain-containing protein [Candidatus Curtissbacteria bacterium]
MQRQNNFAVIILAAGLGKRMRSKTSKVLHEIAGKPIIAHIYEKVSSLNPRQTIIVASPQNADDLKKLLKEPMFVIQKEALGTADAAKAGLKIVGKSIKDVLVMYGDDTALYKPQTILNVFNQHKKAAAKITFVTLEKENPSGFGRIVRQNGKLSGIIEEKDATENQRAIKEINDGLYIFDKDWLLQNLPKLTPSPVTGEYYLTDLIKIALAKNDKVETYKLEDRRQWHGINTPEELEEANRKLKKENLPAARLPDGQGRQVHIMGIAGAGASS